MCSIPKNSKLVYGSGGSKTIIAITPDNNVYKYFPIFLHSMDGTEEAQRLKTVFKYEIEVLKILTKQFIKKNKTPHIVTFYGDIFCNKIPKSFFYKCLDFKDYLLTKKKSDKICQYLYQGYPVTHNHGMFVAHVEYCDLQLSTELSKIIKKSIPTIKNFLDRILFQILYTLEIIKNDFPFFTHRDFFIRNILAIDINDDENNYVRYNLNGKSYDLKNNCICIKINDFGMCQVNKELSKKYLKKNKVVDTPYNDWFNILYDIYDGSGLGSQSLMSLTKNKDKIKFIRKYFSNFMNIKVIDKIIKSGKRNEIIWNWEMMSDNDLVDLLEITHFSDSLDYFYKIFKACPENNIVKIYE